MGITWDLDTCGRKQGEPFLLKPETNREEEQTALFTALTACFFPILGKKQMFVF